MAECNVTIQESVFIAENTVKLVLQTDRSMGSIRPGQFLTLSTPCQDQLLRRPFGIVACQGNLVTVCFQLAGKGTQVLADAPVGTRLSALIPLGNGFPEGYKKVALIGGGVGVFPLLSFASQKDFSCRAYLGFRGRANVCCEAEFAAFTEKNVVTTDDGSYGRMGNAVDAFLADDFAPEAIFACGPKPMFRALQEKVKGTPVFASLEERMGCGVGACLVCTCDTTDGKKRVCKDGPVFPLDRVTF